MKYKVGDHVKVINPIGYVSRKELKSVVKNRIAKIVKIHNNKTRNYPYLVEFISKEIDDNTFIWKNLGSKEFRMATEDEIMAEMI